MTVRTSNQKCRSLVQSRTEFKGHQLYGEYVGDAYVVFSYGPHWPLFAYINGQWYENNERYSASTSKQRGQAHPHTAMVEVDCETLRRYILDAEDAAKLD